MIGTSDRSAAYPVSDAIDPVDIHATIYHAMGLKPDLHLRDHLDRPWPLTTGKAVRGLV